METAEDVSTVDYNWDNLSVGNLHASQASTSFFGKIFFVSLLFNANHGKHIFLFC